MSHSLITSSSISQLTTIHPIVKSDEQQIYDLFYADVYHWTRWVRPIFFHGVLGLLKIPISITFLSVIGVCLCYDLSLGYQLAWIFALFLLVFTILKLVLFLVYFWYDMPEFRARNLTEFYSQDGFAFFVAKLDDGTILGCVGVQKVDATVRLLRCCLGYSRWIDFLVDWY